ncbi:MULTISPECIES: DNA gyrase subunit A [unclassified Wenzhouxiangella]|uniref:DNA gyrase subunit A n=1 Tax=unclassified Wenzhouxiangella TaxID=2613841 RepID=UPI000E32A16C|nr:MULTISPECIES: DNA gyrase subunit A [unclassified Wenzhouxiangella]RFF28660.1 DNA gyrase subunit A [Wenzhouxiangella sp. 15181]RFP70283.1 DNA gyrase subunit A [Wenzhouxiangella sp. 15190]
MAEMAREVLQVNLEDEMRQSYLDYAMSVIVGRALPDVRDGLKPVHRRVLFAMHELGNDFNKPYKKSARVVGDVIGKYHPHGDSAVYDTIVRMAQPFSMRYMLVDGQGNFGSIDGDSAAAMRYTEVRMAKIAHQMLADIGKETVNFIPNYDESENEPTVLPARVPNLLVNGASGIAVGMATNIPPHNLGEVISALLAMIRDPDIGIDEIMEHLPGPDFPTAAIINGAAGIDEAYRTGRGRIYMRARTEIETDEDSGRTRIVVTELPYMVNKARLLEKIAELVKEKRVEGISGLRDESDKDGMRMVIELKRGEVAEVVLNNLFQLTQLQSVFGINMVALVDGQPRLLDIRQILSAFLAHRREVVTRRSLYELRKSRERAHILEGLTVAIANLDEVIALIKGSKTPADAREALQTRRWNADLVESLLGQAGAELSRPEDLLPEYGLGEGGYQLSPNQAQAILDLRLQKLTGLEQDKLSEEYESILETIRELMRILSEPDALMGVIHDELVALRDEFDDVRRSEIMHDHLDLTMEDLITPEDVVVTLSHAGYAKYQPLDRYRAQKRGGRGRSAAKTKDEDFVERFWVTNTHDTLLVFTSAGKVYKTKVYQLPQAGHNSRGRPMVNLLPLDEDERINAVLPTREFPDDWFVFFATRGGRVKKTPLSDFANIRSNGIWAVLLEEGDELVDVAFTDGTCDILLFSSSGKTVRFHETDARPMGRQTRGVLGIRLKDDQEVVSMLVAGDADVLLGTANGYGKRTPLEEFPVHKRGGQGVIGIQTEGRNGPLVAALAVSDEDDVMLTSNAGTLVRTSVSEISRMSRNTQGVTLIRLDEDEQLIGMARVAASEEESPGEEGDE